ncbi:hypothetical protein ABGB19_16150 [Mycobacterium sp. B14F4]|uniref:hypothetical protein n=1 Tax=Mycobacterium sp. B14F4 TaxID=3153565 RepID=UPI00325E9075
MNANATRRTARFFALPVISAGIIAGALGFAGAANAGTYSQPDPAIVASPTVKAHPAPSALPGTHHHNRIDHLMNLEPSYHP